jgi:ribosomal protein S18 acetylase RimI-like enzyme
MNRTFETVTYSSEHRSELIRLWRASFEEAVGIIDPHPLSEQERFFDDEVVPRNSVIVVTEGSAVVAFLAYTRETISQLYVRLDHQRMGIGTALLDRAKLESNGSLRLFTFEANRKAQRFYETRGFMPIRRGFEDKWKLADIEYEWIRA